MRESLSKKETPMIIGAGVIIGIIAVALVYFGNPANMGFCIACFLRDTTCYPLYNRNGCYDWLPDVSWLSVPYDPSSCRR